MPYEPVLLANINKPDSHTLKVYEAGGGYRALQKALKEMSPDEVQGAVRASGLRGRGGAGFPTGLKWSFLPKDHPGPIYLCVNADESEPGTFVNRVQMEFDPHQIVEGIILSCLRHASHHGLPLYPLRISIRHQANAGGDRRSLRRRAISARTSKAHRFRSIFTSIAEPGLTSAAKRPA